jgi:hypothetical protein
VKNVTRIVLAAAALAATSAAWAGLPGTAPPVSVPEPGSLALLAAGVAGAVAALRGRRK